MTQLHFTGRSDLEATARAYGPDVWGDGPADAAWDAALERCAAIARTIHGPFRVLASSAPGVANRFDSHE